jgi:cation diffusion facilitator family transporter
MSTGGSKKVIVLALAANLGIAISKFVGAFISGSASLFAEAIHSVVDCTNQVLLLVGAKASAKSPDEAHPLGYGREGFFWSFIVAILLFSMGGLFAIYEGLHKLKEHDTPSAPGLALGILGVGIVLEGISFRACLHEVRARNPYPSLWQWFHKTTSADLLVIFTEDAAALVGLVVAAVGISLASATRNSDWDAYGSIGVGVVLVVVAVLLAIEVKSLLIGEAPSVDLRPVIEGIVHDVIPEARVLRFIALQTGGSEILVSYKISPGALDRVDHLIEAINEIERRVKARFPDVRWQFVEPDDRA